MNPNGSADVQLAAAAAVFKALGHPERIRIAARLADGSTTTQHELLEHLPWAQSTVARHVSVLRDRGILEATRHGNEVYLRLADDLVPRLLELVRTHIDADDAWRPQAPAAGLAEVTA